MFHRRLALLSLLMLSGCIGGQSLNRAQFDRLKLGMTPTEVEEILGKGKAIDAGEVERLLHDSLAPNADAAADLFKKMDFSELRGMRWGTDKKHITVIYRNERLFRVFQQGL